MRDTQKVLQVRVRNKIQKYEGKVLSVFLSFNSDEDLVPSNKGVGTDLFFPSLDKFTVKCQGKISLSQEVKSTGHLEEKIKDDNVKLSDNFDSSLGND